MAPSLLKEIGDGLVDFVDWVRDVLADEATRKAIAADLGLAPGESISKPPDRALTSVDTYRAKGNPDREAFFDLIADVRQLYANVRTAISGFGDTDDTRIDAVLYLLFDVLASNYVRLYFPRAFAIAQALSAIVEDTSAIDDDPSAFRRFFTTLARAEEFALSPIGYSYLALANSVVDEKQAREFSDRIFPQLAAAFVVAAIFEKQFGTKEIIYGWDAVDAQDIVANPAGVQSKTPLADTLNERMLTFAFPGNTPGTALGLTLAIVPRTLARRAGLMVHVHGSGKAESVLSEHWKFSVEASADPAASILINVDDWRPETLGTLTVPLHLGLVSLPGASDITYAFPHPDETRLEIGQLALTLTLDPRSIGTNLAIQAQALRCALVIKTKDQDGFLSSVLPTNGLRVPFSFGLGFSEQRGFYSEGDIDWPSAQPGGSARPLQPTAALAGVAREASAQPPKIPTLSARAKPELATIQRIDIGKSLLGVGLKQLLLGFGPSPEPKPGVTLEISAAVEVKLGPVVVTMDRIGFQSGLSFPEAGGNVGFADLSFGFKSPSGAGIAVDSELVKGGGFLVFDPDQHRYGGAAQLTFCGDLTLDAIGIISTRLPNGDPGFSFVVMLALSGLELRLGPFTITAFGGVLGIHRTCNDEFLRAGLRSNTLDDLLFPKDPLRDFVRIFGTLNNAFPVQHGSYMFGLAVRATWGTKSFGSLDLGVIYEWGHRNRFVILGRITLHLPTKKFDLILIQLNVLGVVDLTQRRFALDATLYGSRLCHKFPLTGSAAMRFSWGAEREFALSIGGFHPAFKPPASMPRLERLTITFSNTERYRLRGSCYLALTSNTLQLGCKLDLYVQCSKFNVAGAFGVDLLVQYDPFGFVADLVLSVQLRMGTHNLFKLKLEGELSGLSPVHIKGKVTFEILWCDFSVSVDKTFNETEAPPALEPVSVSAQLIEALQDSSSWMPVRAQGQRGTVALRESTDRQLIALHPMDDISVKQTVVPLELTIERFGNAKPVGTRFFAIESLSLDDRALEFERVEDFFAPGYFLDLRDEEKLSAPSFEPMAAGVRASARGFLFPTDPADVLEETLEFETAIVDSVTGQTRRGEPASLQPQSLDQQTGLGAAARSVLRRAPSERYRSLVAKNSLATKRWGIASTIDGSMQTPPQRTFSQTFIALQQLNREDPVRARSLMLVATQEPAHE